MSLIRINKALARREWGIIFVYFCLFVTGAFIKFPNSAYRGLILTTFNFLHFPAFFILYIILARGLRFPDRLATLGPLIMAVAMAFLLELIQPLASRSATWSDAFVSSAGALTAFWLARLKTQWQSRQSIRHHDAAATTHRSDRRPLYAESVAFIACLTLMCVYLLKPVYSASYILMAKHHAFPQLSAHAPPLNFINWFPIPQGREPTAALEIEPCPQKLSDTAPGTTSGKTSDNTSTAPLDKQQYCITVNPIANTWSGLGQILGFDGWAGYDSLKLEILAEHAFSLIMRIDDSASSTNYGDRYNKEISIKAGVNRISIPLKSLQNLPHREAPLNLERIRKLYLFIAPTENPKPFYLRRIFLAHSAD